MFVHLHVACMEMLFSIPMKNLSVTLYDLLARPENVPRLYDLVQVKDDQIRTAFFFALRNTLVAVDLKQATNIAFQVKPFANIRKGVFN